MAVELGTAYISLVPDTKDFARHVRSAVDQVNNSRDLKLVPNVDTRKITDGFKGAGRFAAGSFLDDFTKAMQSGAGPRSALIGTTIGHTVALGIRGARSVVAAAGHFLLSTLKTAAIGGAAAVGAALTAALFKGFERFTSLDRARRQLDNLNRTFQAAGKEGINVAKTMEDVRKVVEGTPVALNEAFAQVPQLLAANIKPGEQLTSVLTAMADAAGFSGSNFSELALVFDQIINKGKLMGDEVMQLQTRGIPIDQWLMESFKFSPDALEQAKQDGKVGITEVIKAVEDHAAGMAKEMGNTVEGALSNLGTAVARIGNNLLVAVFGGEQTTASDNMVAAIKKVQDRLDALNKWVTDNQGNIRGFFLDAAAAAVEFAEGIAQRIGMVIESFGMLGQSFGDTYGFILRLDAALQRLTAMPGSGGDEQRRYADELDAQADAAFRFGDAWVETGRKLQNTDFSATTDKLRDLADQARDGADASSQLNHQLGALAGQPPITPSIDVGLSVNGQPITPQQFSNMLLSGGAPAGTNPLTAPLQQSGVATGLTPQSQAVQDYFRNTLGFKGVIGGVRADAQYPNEHPAGKALDVMVGGAAEGYAYLPNALSRPGVKYVIWDKKMWYPDGRSEPYTGPSPHTDHLHIHTEPYAQGGQVDSVPAMLTPGEHVLTVKDVAALGGQRGVYDFRRGLHMQSGGAVDFLKKIPDIGRTAGAIPAGAGSTMRAGESSIAGLINLGGDFINNLIDQGAQMAATAASMAAEAGVAGGTMGAGAPGAPAAGAAAGAAAQFAIGMGSEAAKRGVKYGFQMLGIGVDSLLAQLTPFGQPRWLTQDYTGFVPMGMINSALGDLMTAGAKDAMAKQFGSAVDPNTVEHGLGQGAPPGPGKDIPSSIQHGLGQGAPPGPNLFPNAPTPVANDFTSTELSSAPQPPSQQPIFNVENIYAQDAADVGRQLTARGQLQMMQYAGRPYA